MQLSGTKQTIRKYVEYMEDTYSKICISSIVD